MKKFSVCILANEDSQSHLMWVKAVQESDSILYYNVVNLTSDNWLRQICAKNYDILLLKPPVKTELFKRLYDERVLLLSNNLKIPVYPSPQEIFIYENKRYLRDWLDINEVPCPKTHVLFDINEAKEFVKKQEIFPIVGKTNIGASGNGVVILRSKNESLNYVRQAFSNGIKPKLGPKIHKGSIFKKIKKVFSHKGFFKQRLLDYKTDMLNLQYHYVILQEYIEHGWEWRCVRIGDSYFAHKKIVRGNMASGSLIKGYEKVPVDLLNFIKNITEKNNLTSVAIDVFEHGSTYLVNEIQCFFGQSDPYQMLVDGKPGRYVNRNGQWLFEEGMFNTNESYDLRLEHALKMVKS